MSNSRTSPSARRATAAWSTLALLAMPIAGLAQTLEPPGGAFRNARSLGLVVENDIITGDDSGYTNGIGFVSSLGPFERFEAANVPDPLLALVRRTWVAGLPGRVRGRTYGFAQLLQTPDDIETPELQVDDVPYAALLSADMSLYAFDEVNADRLTVTVGIVGPWALGEQSQKSVHKVIGSDEPLGWDNQLDNEPVFQIEAARSRRLPLSGAPGASLGTDLVAVGDASIGNLSSGAAVGLLARTGRSLDTSHAVASLVPNRQVNPTVFGPEGTWYAFVGAELRYIANDILIDGNTFEDSHSVPLDHTRTRISVGASANVRGVGLSILYARFPGNTDDDAFGAVSATWRY